MLVPMGQLTLIDVAVIESTVKEVSCMGVRRGDWLFLTFQEITKLSGEGQRKP